MSDIRILVTGWRYWPREASHVIWNALTMADSMFAHAAGGLFRTFTVVQGECEYGGADLYSHEWAEEHRQHDFTIRSEGHPARNVNGRIYGGERNTVMVNRGANLCLSFPGPSFMNRKGGTYDCTMKARAAGIPCWTFFWDPLYAELNSKPIQRYSTT